MSFLDTINKIPETIGEFWNGISGVTATQKYEKEMADTAYQRAIKDMKEAGLNPAMLYGNGGSGAYTPNGSGNSASAVASSINSTANIFNSAAKMMHESHEKKLDRQIANTALKSVNERHYSKKFLNNLYDKID